MSVLVVSQNRRVKDFYKLAKLGFEKPVARCEHRLARRCVGGFLLVVAVSQNRRVKDFYKLAKLGFEKPVARCEHRLARVVRFSKPPR
ncbi:hypothetical protein DTQ70_16615 [Runella sp. SP2]|nr:hypothetical protein DTQ70_16615 [Runella sp. SP2]